MSENDSKKRNREPTHTGGGNIITHRVIARPVNGDEFIRENFEVSTDADKYFDELQKEGSIIEPLLDTFPAISITLEELHLGEWVVKSRKLVIK